MKKNIHFAAFLFFNIQCPVLFAQYNIGTVAGTGVAGFIGDGSQATAGELNKPWGVTVDPSGNVYIADYNNQRVRKVNTSGVISTFAGNGGYGSSGDGGPASAAELKYPTGVASDAAGNIYIADSFNSKVRKVNTSGIISTVAGSGGYGFAGDGGQATAAKFTYTVSVGVDVSGNIFIGDFYNYRIRKVNTSGVITSFAGNGTFGYLGDGGQATEAELKNVVGVCADGTGNVYIADEGNARIRMVDKNGIITTFAGNGSIGYFGDGGPATAAELAYPYGVASDSWGDLFIADYSNASIREVQANGNMITVAGNQTPGYYGDGGAATAAEINTPTSVALDAANNIYICDNGNNRIRELAPVAQGINEIADKNEVSVYPNPSNGRFAIQIKNSEFRIQNSIEVYNMLGQLVKREELISKPNSFDISNNPAGIYLYRIVSETGNIVSSGRLIVE